MGTKTSPRGHYCQWTMARRATGRGCIFTTEGGKTYKSTGLVETTFFFLERGRGCPWRGLLFNSFFFVFRYGNTDLTSTNDDTIQRFMKNQFLNDCNRRWSWLLTSIVGISKKQGYAKRKLEGKFMKYSFNKSTAVRCDFCDAFFSIFIMKKLDDSNKPRSSWCNNWQLFPSFIRQRWSEVPHFLTIYI